jgi:hypothetical protein
MLITLFAAYVLGSIDPTPYVQTLPKVTSRLSTSRKSLPGGKRQAIQKGRFMQVQLLPGAWSECSDCDGNFLLKENNQVIFYDPGTDGKQEAVHWKVANGKLSFIYKDGDVVTDTIIKLTKDSLVLYRRDKAAGVVGYSRFVRLK